MGVASVVPSAGHTVRSARLHANSSRSSIRGQRGISARLGRQPVGTHRRHSRRGGCIRRARPALLKPPCRSRGPATYVSGVTPASRDRTLCHNQDSPPMIKVLMVASEAAPFAKTGGLADVVGSLPAALRAFDCEVAVLIPRYRGIDLSAARRVYDYLPVWLGGSVHEASLYQIDIAGVVYYFLEIPSLYDRAGYYGDAAGDYPDNAVRFAVLSRAALAVARRVFRPRILHCHDWQTGLIPVYLRTVFAYDPTFIGMRTLYTIHNLGYQGLFPPTALPQIGLDRRVFNIDGLEFFGKVSCMKGGINFSDAISTVSRRYASEIQTEEYGFGLDGALRARAPALHGILNGVDYSQWSPETDRYLAAHYSADALAGKRICKQDLVRQFGLPPAAMDRPLLGVVSRLTSQKGTELILEIAAELAADDLYLVVL